MEFIFTIPSAPAAFIFDVANVTIGGVCDDATVENSDASYSDTVVSGGTLVLPDEDFEFQLDGVMVTTETEPALSSQTFNINWE